MKWLLANDQCFRFVCVLHAIADIMCMHISRLVEVICHQSILSLSPTFDLHEAHFFFYSRNNVAREFIPDKLFFRCAITQTSRLATVFMHLFSTAPWVVCMHACSNI